MAKTVAEYLSLGMDERTARYFAAGRRRIVSARPLPDFQVELVFDNGEVRMLDCGRKLTLGSLFRRLVDVGGFERVFVDLGGNLAWDIDPTVDSSVVWSNRIDFCRDACYLESVPVKT